MIIGEDSFLSFEFSYFYDENLNCPGIVWLSSAVMAVLNLTIPLLWLMSPKAMPIQDLH